MDLFIMFIGVNIIDGPAVIFKIISNIIVIILNYLLSKVLVFKKQII
jgi:putative flippase GtrA